MRVVKSSLSFDPAPKPASNGRPAEIEEVSNAVLIHPLARALVGALLHTPVTPNQVSIASVFAAAAAAYCYLAMPWPWGPIAGLAALILWHVLDGADGDLARRSGRTSDMGELIDGVCDHLSQVLVNVAYGIILQRTIGGWAWAIVGIGGAAHFVQSNAYETGRKTYRRWVYGADWMRQTLPGSGGFRGVLGGFYMAFSTLFSPGEAELESAMAASLVAGSETAARARDLYRQAMAPLVKRSGLLGGNSRTMVGFLSLLIGSPIWYYIFEIVVLNGVLAITLSARARANRRLAHGLALSATQAASAPN